jgi:glycosyltransferase involved in cell wall biosynthesis
MTDDRRGHVVMGLLFYPRGGSAYVVRYLSPALAAAGWSVSLATGSLGPPGEETNAATFFAGLDVHALDYTDAAKRFEAGGDPIAAPVPMQPSYEDRPGVPDLVLAAVDPRLAGHLAAVWEAPLRAAGADRAGIFHLHHLTPQLDAVRTHWPHVPLVVHLHGTELKMIAAIEEPIARGEPDPWPHGRHWAAHLKRRATLADHVITVSPSNRDAAIEMLGLAPEHVTALPNGVDIERFAPRPRTPESRRAAFRRFLVDDPQGWSPTGPPGTVAYSEADLDRLLGPDDDATVLLFVGRFLGFKRVPALVRAFARARDRFTRPGSLVVWGGHPGEWEGEHPVTVADEVGRDGMFFTGWRGHDDLPAGLAAGDVLVVPSVEDPYPQVPLEAMAVGLPVLACESGGLRAMVNVDPDRPTGWFVPPDDPDALTDALVSVVNDPGERVRRGAFALEHARADLSWDGLVPRFEAVYAEAAARHEARARQRAPG